MALGYHPHPQIMLNPGQEAVAWELIISLLPQQDGDVICWKLLQKSKIIIFPPLDCAMEFTPESIQLLVFYR